MEISVYIIAFNEAEKIKDCINSVLWADEIIVADSNSTDGTTEIAESIGAKVVHIPFDGYGNLRNKAISYCTKDWILSIDSDERCTEAVRDEILSLINKYFKRYF
jgi:glycosyltransferase involved in cell wall biosynthesis